MKRTLLTIIIALAALTAQAQSLWNREHLERVKNSIDDPAYAQTIKGLMNRADRMLDVQPYSVMQKKEAPASGDIHDYMSLARYFWPDPESPDGLPYINRDGVSNPELQEYDRDRLGAMADLVSTMSLAWFFTGDEKYAAKAAQQLRVWFLDPATRMNPQMEYAQVAKGHNGNKGRSYGLIDSYSFVDMLDGVALLEASPSFPEADSKALKQWFKEYLKWFLESPQGVEESKAANNHSIAYDVQAVAYAIYAGETQTARQLVATFPRRRIFAQVAPDGSQPEELWRTLAFGYSQYNLSHMIDVILMGKKMGIDIADMRSSDGRSFFSAMDWLAQYVGKKVEDWPYQQISDWDGKQQEFCKDLYRTATYIDKSRTDYMDLYKRYAKRKENDLFNILYWEALQ